MGEKSDRHQSRSGNRDRHRRSRSRDRSRHRSRDRESSSKKKKKSRRGSRSKSADKKTGKNNRDNILDDDDFARKLSDHLSGSGGEKKKKSRSRSKEKSRRSRKSRSRSREKSGDKRKDRRRSSSKSSKRKEKSKEKDSKETGGWQSVGQNQFDDSWTAEESDLRRKSFSAKPMANVFGSEEELDDKKKKVPVAKKVPASGGMWIPTGEDSILDGVKDAISRLEEKQRFGGRGGPSRGEKWDQNRKIKMTEEAPPPSKEYDVTFDSRTGMYVRVPKQLTMAEKIASSKMTQMDREKAKDKDVQEVEERIVRKLSNSPPRLPTKRRSLSKERKTDRSRSRERRRSVRRSVSRSRRHSSRSRRHRSRSKDHRRRSKSKSGSRSRNRSKKDRSSFDKTNTIQQEITGMREETRRLQSEREAIEREKALLLAGPRGGAPSTGTLGPSKLLKQSSRQDEFSGLDNVMNSVLEAVDRTKRKNSPVAPPSKIIPGAETFEDLEAFIKRKKSEKLEEMKKKM